MAKKTHRRLTPESKMFDRFRGRSWPELFAELESSPVLGHSLSDEQKNALQVALYRYLATVQLADHMNPQLKRWREALNEFYKIGEEEFGFDRAGLFPLLLEQNDVSPAGLKRLERRIKELAKSIEKRPPLRHRSELFHSLDSIAQEAAPRSKERDRANFIRTAVSALPRGAVSVPASDGAAVQVARKAKRRWPGWWWGKEGASYRAIDAKTNELMLADGFKPPYQNPRPKSK